MNAANTAYHWPRLTGNGNHTIQPGNPRMIFNRPISYTIFHTNIINDCWQNSRRWQCVHLHQGRRHGIQRRGRVNNIPKKTHYHRKTRWMRPIPHTIDPGSRAMATTQSNQEIQEWSSTGQYRIRSSIHIRIHQGYACGLRISSQIHMDQGHKSR